MNNQNKYPVTVTVPSQCIVSNNLLELLAIYHKTGCCLTVTVTVTVTAMVTGCLF